MIIPTFLQMAGQSDTVVVGKIVGIIGDTATVEVRQIILGSPVAGNILVSPMSVATCLGRSSTGEKGQEVLLLLTATAAPKRYTLAGGGHGMMTLQAASRAADLEAARKLIELSRLKGVDELNRAMLEHVKSGNATLRREACEYVSREIAYAKNRQDYADQLVPLLSADEKEARGAALAALQFIRVEKAIPQMIEATHDKELANAASLALAHYDTPESTAALIDLVHGPDVQLRKRAAIDLERSRRPESIDALLALLDDPEASVREMAPRRLTMWLWYGKGDAVILPKLIGMLEDRDVKIQAEVAGTLGESYAVSIVQPLLDVLARPHLDPTVEVRALGSLSKAYDRTGTEAPAIIRRGVARIAAVLDRNGNMEGEQRSIDLLGRMKTPEALFALQHAAESHSRQQTRDAARQVLERLKASQPANP
jgi:HEAT repeat protein